jgi:hypothetical protein
MTKIGSKIRRLVACLAVGEPQHEARRILSLGEQFARSEKYPLLTPDDVSKLYHPNEPGKRKDLAHQIEQDIEQGLLPCRVSNITTFESLWFWPDRPVIALDHPLADVLPPNPATVERRKKAALIRELKGRWPDIESDLRHADENGLKAVAKLPEHGDWNLTAALQWAKENGKLIDTVSQALNPMETINRMSRGRTRK